MTTTAFPFDLASTTLSAEAIAHFGERGYHIQPGVHTDAEVDAINATADRVIADVYDKGQPPDCRMDRCEPADLIKIDNTWKADTTMANAGLSPRLGYIAAQLIQAPSILM